MPRRRTVFRLAPERFALFSDENDLDYAVVAIGERLDGNASLAELGYCPLSFTPDRHRKGINVNIIQHPNGMPKTVAVRNNLLTERTETRLLYETDTDFGSSGAPVFNDQWDVIALHHYGMPSAAPVNAVAQPAPINVNEGIRISAIYQELEARSAQLETAPRQLIGRALKLWSESVPAEKQLERRPPARDSAMEVVTVKNPNLAMGQDTSPSVLSTPLPATLSLVIPLHITVKIETPTVPGRIDARLEDRMDEQGEGSTKRLQSPSEGGKLDTDYSNRNGFNSRFVPGASIELATITMPKKASVAPLHEGEAAGFPGELRYQNFSVVMHKARRLALLTATNIDGETYIAIDRTTGEPSVPQPEGETWYRDSRISASYFIDQDFYSGWSHLFDRGHLTRRSDPTWGAFATRANRDTFHFTNCSPQHWRFNQSLQYWQGIERYVLENGVFASGRDKPVSVLQGPVFDDENDQWADEVQVPSAFWKIVVWNGAQGLKAVALVIDQSALFAQVRRGSALPPQAGTTVNVTQWRTSVANIEKKSGLDLAAIRAYDTADRGLPMVGEALVASINSWKDIPLT
jgi:endonuclease G, mitochondrial